MASSPAIYHPRRPRASPLWQIVHLAWDEFLTIYEKQFRPAMGPLRPESVAAVRAFSRCGDLAAGFTRLVCTGCGHQHLLAFTCKARHLCPACHQRRTLRSARWIAHHVCLPVPHRQFVFTIPKILRPIIRKRRHLLTHLSRILPPSPRPLGGACQHHPTARSPIRHRYFRADRPAMARHP